MVILMGRCRPALLDCVQRVRRTLLLHLPTDPGDS
jgi:hypothetical protein